MNNDVYRIYNNKFWLAAKLTADGKMINDHFPHPSTDRMKAVLFYYPKFTDLTLKKFNFIPRYAILFAVKFVQINAIKVQ